MRPFEALLKSEFDVNHVLLASHMGSAGSIPAESGLGGLIRVEANRMVTMSIFTETTRVHYPK